MERERGRDGERERAWSHRHINAEIPLLAGEGHENNDPAATTAGRGAEKHNRLEWRTVPLR